jgi:CBS domain-containing protein
MTDLTQVKAATIGPRHTLAQAEQAMVYLGVRMLLVVTHMPRLEGLVTLTDLHGERQMRRVHERQVHFDELEVADVMTGIDELDAIDFARMPAARVSHVIATLQRFGRNHLLVVEAGSGSDAGQRVRGVISRAQIERQLGTPIPITDVAGNFAEIKRALV